MLQVDPFVSDIGSPDKHKIGDTVQFEGRTLTVVKRVPRKDGTVQFWFAEEVSGG